MATLFSAALLGKQFHRIVPTKLKLLPSKTKTINKKKYGIMDLHLIFQITLKINDDQIDDEQEEEGQDDDDAYVVL